MGTLIVRNIDDQTVRLLKERAQRHGRSMEAEHREILRDALAEDRHEAAKAGLAAVRAALSGRPHAPSEVLLRESREER